MKNKTKLPSKIYVFWEGDAPEQYLSAQETNRGIEDGTKVGIYELADLRTQNVTEKLLPRERKLPRMA